eukprot:1526028-Rhodomonas_salina.1
MRFKQARAREREHARESEQRSGQSGAVQDRSSESTVVDDVVAVAVAVAVIVVVAAVAVAAAAAAAAAAVKGGGSVLFVGHDGGRLHLLVPPLAQDCLGPLPRRHQPRGQRRLD